MTDNLKTIIVLDCYSFAAPADYIAKQHAREAYLLAYGMAAEIAESGGARVILASTADNPDFFQGPCDHIVGINIDPATSYDAEALKAGILPVAETPIDVSKASGMHLSFEGEPEEVKFLLGLKQRYPNIYFVNDPEGNVKAENKILQLGFTKHSIPSRIIDSEIAIDRELSSDQDLIILKRVYGYGSNGLLRLIKTAAGWKAQESKTGVEWEIRGSDGRQRLIDKLGTDGSYIAQNVVDPSRERRLFFVGGEFIGGFMRILKPNAWWKSGANTETIETIAQHQMYPEERAMQSEYQENFARLGVQDFSFDTLYDPHAQKWVSVEANVTGQGGLSFVSWDHSAQRGRAIARIFSEHLGLAPTRKPLPKQSKDMVLGQ